MAQQATLVNLNLPATDPTRRVAVDVNSPTAQSYFSKGYIIETAAMAPPVSASPKLPPIDAPKIDTPKIDAPKTPSADSPMAFQQAVGQLMAKAQYNQKLQDQMFSLLKTKYDNALNVDTSGMPLAIQQAVQNRDQSMLDFQIASLRSQIQGRATAETQSLQYLTTGFQDEMTQTLARQKEANGNILKMLSTYGSTLSQVGVSQEEINQYQQTGLMSPTLANKLMQAATINQQKIEIAQRKPVEVGTDFSGRKIFKIWNPDTQSFESVDAGVSVDTGDGSAQGFDQVSTNNGSLSFQNNNPGNIKYGDFAKSYGATPMTTSDGRNFAVFPDLASGTAAMQGLLGGKTYRNLNVNDALHLWSQEKQGVGGYGQEILPKELQNKTVDQIIKDGQLNILTEAIKKQEGWKPAAGGGAVPATPQNMTSAQAALWFSAPEESKTEAKALVEGSKLFSSISKRTGYADKLDALARIIDPKYNESVNIARNKVYQNFIVGSGSVQRQAVNAAIQHIAEVYTLANKLGNKKFGLPFLSKKYNSIRLLLKEQSQNPDVDAFNTAVNKVAAEIAKIYKGSASPTEEEIADEKKNLTATLTDEQIQSITQVTFDLLAGKLAAVRDDYKATMGKDVPFDLIEPAARQKMRDIGFDPNQFEKSSGQAQQPNGTFDPQNPIGLVFP